MNKGSKLPVYGLVAVIVLALVYAIITPKAPELAGPVGAFPTWKSINTRGTMTAQAIDQNGGMWAGAWSQKLDDNTGKAAIHTIDFNGFAASGTDLGKDTSVQDMSWADGNTLRAVCIGHDGDTEVVYIDAQSGKKSRTVPIGTPVEEVIGWPAGSANFAALLEKKDNSLKLAVLSEAGKMIGKEVSFELPKDASLATGAGIAADGSYFVFSVSDPAAKDGKSFYVANTRTGTAKKAFELADVPGRIEGMWPEGGAVLMVCRVKDKLEAAIWDAAPDRVVPQTRVAMVAWPAAPRTMAFTTYNGGYEFHLDTGKTLTLFDTSKKDSPSDKGWRDFLRDSRVYKLKNGNYATVSETGGSVDIREVKPDGTVARAMLSRM